MHIMESNSLTHGGAKQKLSFLSFFLPSKPLTPQAPGHSSWRVPSAPHQAS